MKTAGYIRWLGGLLLFGAAILHAKEFAAQHVGDTAGEDIVTPVALEVIDPTATAALKSVEALKTPAIFRSYFPVTNALVQQFQTTFDETRLNFISALQDTFHQTVLDHATITSPDFGYLVTAFNIKNKQFPIPGFLAMDWAYGKTGMGVRQKWLNALTAQAQSTIRPDDLPAGFDLGSTLRLVPVSRLDEQLTLREVTQRGRMISPTNLIPLAQVRTQFRRAFTGDDEQPLARAMSAWLQPNCLPDATLTQTARDRAVRQLIVAEHYAAGQVIVAQGSVIDAKIKAALDALSEKLKSGANDPAITVIPANEVNESSPAPDASDPTPNKSVETSASVAPSNLPTQSGVKILAPKNEWFAAAALTAGIALIVLWQWRRRAPSVSSVTKDLPWQTPAGLQTELAPQLVRAVQSALVQELAGQRRTLLVTQQLAATEVIRLVHKMDELQVAMQERLATYESQIRELETELAARTEENRELIQLKIQLIRHQLEVESRRRQVQFN